MPCTILRVLSQLSLDDYAVEVRLDRIGVLDYVRDDGSDIYFLDENDQPLHYAVWLIRRDQNYGSVFVKLSLRSRFRRIRICYGERNRYQEYNNPRRVFALYDDFNTLDIDGWRIVEGEPTFGGGHLILKGDTNDTVRTFQKFKDVEVRIYFNFFKFAELGPRLELQTRRLNNTFYAFMNEQFSGNWYYYSIQRVIEGNYTLIKYGSLRAYYAQGDYYEEVYRSVGTTHTWIIQGYMGNRETLTAVDDAITEPGSIALRTWNRLGDVRVDKILVRHAVDPEPVVEVEKPVPRSKPQILPLAVSTTALIGIKKATTTSTRG
ncbi:MAG: DUF2341 domain-containing protein [Desulfurococcaceae archaeon]